MEQIKGKLILVRVSASFEISRVRVIGSQQYYVRHSSSCLYLLEHANILGDIKGKVKLGKS